MESGPINSWQITGGEMEAVTDFIFLGSEITADGDCCYEIKRCLLLGRKAMTNLDNVFKSRDVTLPKEGLYSQSYGFPSSHVWMWELDHREGWASKNWCFQNVVLEKTLENPLDSKEIKSVNPEGNQPWIFIGRTDAEAPIIWPADAKSQLTGKDPGAQKDWGQEEKGAAEDEMVRWHHWLNIHECELTPGDSEGQGSLACCNPWICKWLDRTEQLSNNKRPGRQIVPNIKSITQVGLIHSN